MKNLLGRVKGSILVWVVGAALGLGVGWFFTGFRDTLESILTPSWVKHALLSIHAFFGILILESIKKRSTVEKVSACMGLVLGSLVAPLPVAIIGVYWVMPQLSDLSLVYSEETITLISDFAVVLLPLFFISLTTIIFLLIGKVIAGIARKVGK